MSDYIVYKVTKCKVCGGSGKATNYRDETHSCYYCYGSGEGKVEQVSLIDALNDIKKNNPEFFYYERYPKLK